MDKRLAKVFAAIVVLFASAGAHAQVFRAYLAADGSDANPCTLPQPCRLLPAALNAVASGGEIWMLDSANYNTGTVNIAKSVSILAVPGVVGSVVANGADAIQVSAAGVRVNLRNLVIVPVLAFGGRAILVGSTAELVVEGCTIAGMNGGDHGIVALGTAKVRVSDTTVRQVSGYGVSVGESAALTVAGSRFIANGAGVVVETGAVAKASVDDSSFQGNGAALVSFAGSGSATSSIAVSRSSISGGSIGLYAETGTATDQAEISVATTAVSGMTTPWQINPGSQGGLATIRSFGNNQFSYNGAPIGVLTSIAQQ